MLPQKHPILFTFLIALLIRLTYIGIVQWINPESIYLYDSWGYLNIAYNLYHDQVYSQMLAPPQTLDSTRPPVYPIFIYLFHLFQLHGYWIVIIQAIISSLTVTLAVKTVLTIHKKTFPALIIGGLIALDIPSIYFANTVLTETLFTFFLTGIIYAQIKIFQTAQNHFYLFSGLLVTMAIYTKPIALFLPFVLAFIHLYSNRKKTKLLLFSCLLPLLLISPWFYRNQLHFGGSTFFSSITEVNLLFHLTSEIKAVKENTNRQEIEQRYRTSAPLNQYDFQSNPKAITPFRAFARTETYQTVSQHPWIALKIICQSWITFFIKPIRSYITLQVYPTQNNQTINSVSQQGKHLHLLNRFLKSGSFFEIALIAIQAVFMLILYLALLLSLPTWFKTHKAIFLLLSILVFYFSITASITEVDARFRTPIIPALALLTLPLWIRINKQFNYE